MFDTKEFTRGLVEEREKFIDICENYKIKNHQVTTTDAQHKMYLKYLFLNFQISEKLNLKLSNLVFLNN